LKAIHWLAVLAVPACAHDTRPGILELHENRSGIYSYFWNSPTDSRSAFRISPVIPPGCCLETHTGELPAPGATAVRGTLSCERGLAGRTITIAGLETTAAAVLVRLHHIDGQVESHMVRPDNPTIAFGARTTPFERSLSFVRLGVQHILLGVDHLLFVLGLTLIVSSRWMLVKTITAFTVAHSLTIAVATLGYASVPLPPLDAAIALSILFLGPEIVRTWRGESSFTIRHPWVVAFAFGLLHGFGFASGLTAVGLPAAEIPWALLLFNVGVEAGQIAFVFLVLLLDRCFRVLEICWPCPVERLPGYAVGTLGAYWTIQRTAILLGFTR
jgi:hydrogenase/urease accessory protein HupE